MDKFSYEGITLTTILDTRRAKDELYFPVKYRITYLRKQYYHPSGIDLTEEEWNVLFTTKQRELTKTRELVSAGYEKIKNHIIDMAKNEGFSVPGLKAKLGQGNKDSIVDAFNYKIETLKKDGKIGSADWYFYSLNMIQKFTSKDLKISDITVSWLNSFEAFLLKDEKSWTSISIYMRALRAIVRTSKGAVNQARYPFGLKDNGKYEIPEGEGRALALTLSQIGKVLTYPLNTDVERRSRDLWFFSYMCNGINNNDLLRLKFKDIENGEIRWYRLKTINTTKKKKKIAATLLPEMKTIIDKWGSKSRHPNNYIFPFLSDDMTPLEARTIIKNHTSLQNKKMSAIGKALGYGNISSYWARHSYATVLKRSGANIAYISESLGHTDIKTTEAYLDTFENAERAKNAALLTKFNEE
jgi:integrase